MAGNLKKGEKLTLSQRDALSVDVPNGHVVVNEKYQTSVIVKVLRGSVNLVFDNLGFLDFRTSNAGILLINEAELIAGNCYKKRIVSLAKIQRIRGVVLYEKTSMTKQYTQSLQRFTTINVGLNLYPMNSQENVAKFLIEMVRLNADPQSNPFLFKKVQKPVDQALLSMLQTVPGLGEKKAFALLQRFGSFKALTQASKQDISKVVGDACAQKVVAFFCSPSR